MDKQVYIFDTTLRDGAQSPGAALQPDDKVRIAHALEELGVDVIETGFPISSPAEYEAVARSAREVQRPIICALARAHNEDIAAAAAALSGARHPRIHTFLATSPIHMAQKLRKRPGEVLALIEESVRYARTLVDDVEWSAEDAGRSDTDFLIEAVNVAIAAGATTINLPDTVGIMDPIRYATMVRYVMEHVRRRDDVLFSVHCHNDLGLATANSLAGVLAGARQVECTINGIGERAGNAALEEVVMALRVQHPNAFATSIVAQHLARTSRLVAMATGYPIQPNKAIVGTNAFSHASGIHQDGVAKAKETYEIIRPEDVGATGQERFVLSQSSGRAGLQAALAELGYTLADTVLDEVYRRFLVLAEKRRVVHEEDLLTLVADRAAAHDRPYEVLEARVSTTAQNSTRHAEVRVVTRVNGVLAEHTHTSCAGEVDTLLTCVQQGFGVEAELCRFQAQAIGRGSDALAQVTLTIVLGDTEYLGSAADESTAIAALKAYVNALNRWARSRH